MEDERKKIRYVGVEDLNDLVARIKLELEQKTVAMSETEETEEGTTIYKIMQGNRLVGEIVIPEGIYEFMDDATIDEWFTEEKEDS